MATLKTRVPTGRVPWPFVLVEGPEKSGKSWAAATLSASPRVGQTYWLDLGEGAADEYAAIPGANYLVIDHDGTWIDIVNQVAAVRDEARAAADAGKPPVVLVIDSLSAEWEMLRDWANSRALKSDTNQKRLARDPNAEVLIGMNLWNAATARHKKLMTLLLTFPGIVVATARGKQVAALADDGRPIEGTKDYKVEGHKNLVFDASVVVRLSNQPKTPPMVVSCRSVKHGLRPGVDDPVPAPNFTLEWLIFDALGCDPTTAHVRDLQKLDGGELLPEEMPEVEAEDKPRRQPGAGARPGQAGQRTNSRPATPRPAPAVPEDVLVACAQIIDDAAQASDRETVAALWKEASTAGWMSIRIQDKQLGEHLTEHVARVKALGEQGATATQAA